MLCRLVADGLERLFQAELRAVAEIDPGDLETGPVVVRDFQEFAGRQDRSRENDAVGVARVFFENIPLSTQTGLQRHDHGFTQRIDGGIGYLRKLLPEVVGHVPHTA